MAKTLKIEITVQEEDGRTVVKTLEGEDGRGIAKERGIEIE